MQVAAHAKINWFLRVTGKRPDGYHDLETLFQTISLHDTLTFTESDRLTLTCDDPSIPTDESNLILRAARALGTPPVAIELRKRIPAGGGLGGGSSDAAATLMALATMFSIETPLHEIALSLGSDVPFFLVGGTAYATGRGEELTPMPSVAGIPLVLLFPEERVATPRAFGKLCRFSKPLGIGRVRTIVDRLRGGAAGPSVPRFLGFLGSSDSPGPQRRFPAGTRGTRGTEEPEEPEEPEQTRNPREGAQPFADLTNDFEEPIFAELPHLAGMKTQLYALGAAWAGMSGSGSTIVGAFRDAAARDAALAGITNVRAAAAETT